MTPEEKLQFDELKRLVEGLSKNVQDVIGGLGLDFIDNINDRQIKKIESVTTTGITGTEVSSNKALRTQIVNDGNTVTFPDLPDKWLVRRHKGKDYRIGAYEL